MNRHRRYRLLMPVINMSSFIQWDIDLLQQRYDIVVADSASLLASIWSLRLLRESDCVVCWFGSLRYLPLVLGARLLNRSVVIIAGGYDVADMPAIRYGNLRGGVRRSLGRMLFRLAHSVACISESAAAETIKNARVPSDRVRMVYLAVPDKADGPTHAIKKESLVLTVGHCNDSSLHRKGFLAVARLSTLLPDVTFVIAGSCSAKAEAILKSEGGENVLLTGYVSIDELQRLFSRASVYLQPSRHEGFGVAVAEAMLHGCIPVASNLFSLPEIVGGAGILVDPDDLNGIAEAILAVLNNTFIPAEAPRERILQKFNAANREKELSDIIDATLRETGSIAGRSSKGGANAATLPDHLSY